MRTFSAVLVMGVVSLVTLSVACSKDQPPAAAPAASAQPMYGQPPGAYPPGPQPGAPTAPPPGQPMPPAAGQMAVPGPTALACQNDSQCMTHRCNTQYGKCAFPCQSDNDCIQGSTCFVAGGPVAACLPKPPGT
jgi:hypothetical protein